MNRALLPLLVAALPSLAAAGELSPFLLRPPPSPDGAKSLQESVPRVAIRLAGPVDRGALEALRRAGAEPVLLPSGRPAVVGPLVSATVPRERLAAVAALPGVERVDPALPVLRRSPLDRTAAQVEAPRLWWPTAEELGGRLLGNLGEGVVVADHEGGWDPFHPDFFRPDAGRYDFEDVDGDGVAGEGDRVDLDGDGHFEAELSLLEGLRSNRYGGEQDYHEPGYQPDVDWLFVDEDADGQRDYGERAGFSDAVPAFGEPIFAADDADGSGAIEPGEKLLRLGTSKIRAISVEQEGRQPHLFRRGVDLTAYPVEDLDDSSRGHGTGAIGIVAGGWPGVRRYTGLAPGVELVLVAHDDPVSAVAAAAELGAQVNFYEWDEFIAAHDGSGPAERAISEAAATGSVHVAAAGNLANASHVIELAPLGTEPVTARFSTDGYGVYHYQAAWLNLTWTGEPGDVAWALIGSDGSRFEPGAEEYSSGRVAGVTAQAWVQRTDRGNSWVMVYLGRTFGSLPEDVFTLEVRATSGEVTRFRGLVVDDVSGWGQGVAWLDHLSDAGTALSPSTADRVIAVAAHGGTHDFSDWGWGDVGERRAYSGMGPRLDGAPVIDLSGPDDPYAPRSDSEASHGAYDTFGGTSGALPHVTAAAALVLAERPALDHDGVEAVLKAGALADRFTGELPNEAFGHGKVRVARALGKPARPDGEAPVLSLSAAAAVAGRPVEVVAAVEGGDGIRVAFDVGNDGEEEVAPGEVRTFTFVPERPGPVVVAAWAVEPGGRQARKALVVDVQEGCAIGGCPDGMVCGDDGLCVADGGGGGPVGGGSRGGGGCAAAGGSGLVPGSLWPLALALLLRRRRA